jgi:glycosyltransferase involved in cell wall biosynthesis
MAEDVHREGASEPIVFRPGDVLLMLDSSWARFREFFPVFERARGAGIPIYTVVYDLLPLTLPPGNFVEGGREWFNNWFDDAVSASDGLVCISKATADDVINYVSSMPKLASGLKIGYWHLGSDFSSTYMEGTPSAKTTEMASLPYLVMIGTIEPRKNHALALSAMEKLWEAGHELSLCIAGKEGWMVGELMERLRNHPLLGRRLFLIEGPSDSDIDFLYKNAAGLLFLSKGEGFGLPLVEAANHGIPIVCSDIPVLHEIAGQFATYVTLTDVASIATDLSTWWKNHNGGDLPNTSKMPRLSWEESAEALMDVVLDNNWLRAQQ